MNEKKIRQLEKNITTQRERRDKVADDARRTAERLEKLRADAVASVVDGKDPARIYDNIADTELRLATQQRAVAELDRTVADAEGELLAYRRDGDLEQADAALAQFTDAVRAVKTALDGLQVETLEKLPYDVVNLAGRHQDSRRVAVGRACRGYGATVAVEAGRLRGAVTRALDWLETVQA